MTPEEADDIVAEIIDSTDAPPGLKGATTGKRITAPGSFTYGYGLINGPRTLSPLESTIADPSVYVGAIVSGMSFMGFALPLSTKSAGEAYRSLFG